MTAWRKGAAKIGQYRKLVRSSAVSVISGLVGPALLTSLAGYVGTFGRDHSDSRAVQTVLVTAASLAAFGALWVVKFVAFNRYMFTPKEQA